MSRTPSLAVHVAIEDGVRSALGRERATEIAQRALRAEGAKSAMISVAFVSNRTIATLNRKHLAHRGPTDVISFGFAPSGPASVVVGDIYIAPDVARDNARANGNGVREELARLVIHGVLHVLGHDHPVGDDRTASPMWRRQEQLLRRLAGAR